MKRFTMHQPLIYLGLFFLLFMAACTPQTQESPAVAKSTPIFPKGNQGPADFFTGTVWVHGLVANDTIYDMNAGKVTFEPQARSHWHSHPAGQILIVTDGVGYHQIKGQSKETIRKGDVVKCPPNKTHWHGASKDSSMTHIYILPNTEKGIVEWMEAVTDEEFNN